MFRLLPPPVRLLCLLLLTTICLTETRHSHIAVLFLTSLTFFLTSRNRPWRQYVTLTLPTVVLYFAGNVLTTIANRRHLAISRADLAVAMAASLRIGAILTFSYSWLVSSTIVDIYSSFSWLRPARPVLTRTLRALQIFQQDFQLVGYAARIRSRCASQTARESSRFSLGYVRNRIALSAAILRSVIGRQFSRIPLMTYSAFWLTQAKQDQKSPPAPRLELAHLGVRYSADLPLVLTNCSATLSGTQVVGVVGPTASGKTTMLRALSGIVPKLMGEIAGDVVLAGTSTRTLPLSALLRRIQFVDNDDAAMVVGLNVRHELLIASGDPARIPELARAFGLEHLLSVEATKLSGGQFARLAIAAATARSSSATCWDEPFNQLDSEARALLLDHLYRDVSLQHYLAVASDGLTPQTCPDALAVGPRLLLLPQLGRQNLLTCIADGQISGSSFGQVGQREEAVLVARDVTVKYGDAPAVESVSLKVCRGDLVTLRGPNGSGKTTLALALAGALAPTSGEVVQKGPVALLFQDPLSQAIGPTARDEAAAALSLAPAASRLPDEDPAAICNAARVEPTRHVLDLHPAELRRLLFEAMIRYAAVIILDEPTNDLDISSVRELLEKISYARASGIAIILISHDPRLPSLSTHNVQMSHGTISHTSCTSN